MGVCVDRVRRERVWRFKTVAVDGAFAVGMPDTPTDDNLVVVAAGLAVVVQV